MRCTFLLTFNMATVDFINFENILEDIERRCRTCLGICTEFNVLSKCVEVGEGYFSLTEVILGCASVQISEQDEFPQHICESCKDAAIKSHLFKVQCETSDKYLHSISQRFKLLKNASGCDNNEVIRNNISIGPNKAVEEKPTCKTLSEITDISDDSQLNNEINETKQQYNKKEHICHNCNDRFYTKKSLIKHQKIHVYDCDDIKKRTCPYCAKVFQYRTSMLKHQRKHNAPPKTCTYCDYKPTSPSNLSKHMEETHAHLKTFNCSLCNKTFFKKGNLRLHVQVHSGVKKHTCEICGMSFVLRGNLSVHRRLHTGEKPYTCSSCGRGFIQQSALRSHEAGHSDRRDHVCADCGAAFSRAGALRNHQKRHSEERPFECSVCGKKFTFSSERKRHMLIHTGDKNFECEVCGRRFTRGTNLKVHKRIHTGETPHVCGVCGKGFIQAHCLRTHMNTHVNVGYVVDRG